MPKIFKAEIKVGYHCHDPTDAERGHNDVARLILQLLIQPTTKHLQRLMWCVRKSSYQSNLKMQIAFTVFPVATAATWLTALILSDMMRLLIGRDGGADGRLWQPEEQNCYELIE